MSSSANKLCISLMPTSLPQLKEWIPESQDGDLIEVRIDHLPKTNMKNLRKMTDQPLIVTLRSEDEGGFWQGDAASCQKIYQSACNAGIDYIDVELQNAEAILAGLKKKETGIVLSRHIRTNSLQKLKHTLAQMLKIPADVYKLIFTATALKDNLAALALINEAQTQEVPFVIHAMGDAGKNSRLIGAIKGNAWTYVAREFNETTASGQITIHEAEHYYNLKKKRPNTRLLGLTGSPISQSKGWRLHNQLFREKLDPNSEEDYLYLNYPAEDFQEFWEAWQLHLHGLSVTIPHKESVVDMLDEITTEVKISGTCNTIVRSNNGWKGYNTDLMAIEILLRRHREKIRDGGLVIGTGATARSALAALKRLEVNPIFIVGRNEERGRYLNSLYGAEYLLEDEIHYATASVIIQTTPVGMVPYTDQHPPGTSLFRKNRIVMDVIYNPLETKFLSIARERGCITINGMEMFLLQAAKQFEVFTGTPLTPEEIQNVWNTIS